MRKYGTFLIENRVYGAHERCLGNRELEGARTDGQSGIVNKNGTSIGVEIDGVARSGFPTPSRKLEFFSKTLKE
jgi:hypothetical protein